MIWASVNRDFRMRPPEREDSQLIRASTQGERQFHTYAELLEALPELDQHLPPDVCETLAEDARALRALAGPAPRSTAAGPWLLHTARTPLIDQVAALVPPDAVDHIVAISPFFDSGCRALRALAERYPSAKLCVIKPGPLSGGSGDDFAGSAVRSLGRRLRVQELETVAGEQRRLHAKLVAFWGPGGAWLLTGSANLTDPAWLRAAGGGPPNGARGGNLEACVLRVVQQADIKRVLKPLTTKRVDYRELRYDRPATLDPASVGSAIVLLEAEVNAGHLTIHAESGAWCDGNPSIRVAIEARGERVTFEVSRRKSTERVAVLSVSLEGHRLAEDDAPAIVTVEALIRDRAVARGRLWLVRPALLALSSEARARRRAVQQMMHHVFVGGGDYEFVADAVAALATEVGDLLVRGIPRPTRPMAGGESATAPDHTRYTSAISLDEYVTISDDDIAAYHTTGRRPHSAPSLLQQLVRATELLFREDDPDTDDADASPSRGELRQRSGAISESAATLRETETDPPWDDQATVPAVGDPVVRYVAVRAQAIADRALNAPIRAEAVEYVVRLLTAVAGVLLRLHVQAALRAIGAAAVPLDVLRELFARALSLTGTLTGAPRGWLIRAWADPSSTTAVSTALAEPVRFARLAAMYGAAFGGAAPENADGTSSTARPMITAGLHLLRSHVGVSRADFDVLVAEQASRLVTQSRGVLATGALLAALVPPSASDLPLMRSVRRWKPLLDLLDADRNTSSDRGSAVQALAAADPRLFALYSRVRRSPAAVALLRHGSRSVCEGCNTAVPTQVASIAERDVGAPQTCEGCRRILVPLAINSPVTRAVIAALVDHTSSSSGNADPATAEHTVNV